MSEQSKIERPYQDGSWHWVKYEGLHKEYGAPAMYKANCDAWYSFEFSGIPTRQVEVIGPCVPDSLPVGVPDGCMPIPTARQIEEALENVGSFHDMSAELIAPDLLANLLAAVPAAPTVKAEQVDMADAYVGAREDLSIWKRRALEAEQKVRHQEQIIDHLTLEAQGETRFGEPSLPAAGSTAEEVEVVGTRYSTVSGHGRKISLVRLSRKSRPGWQEDDLMTVAQHNRIVAALSAQQSAPYAPERVSVPKLAGLQSVNHQLGIVALSFKNSEQTQEAVRELRALLASHGRGEA